MMTSELWIAAKTAGVISASLPGPIPATIILPLFIVWVFLDCFIFECAKIYRFLSLSPSRGVRNDISCLFHPRVGLETIFLVFFTLAWGQKRCFSSFSPLRGVRNDVPRLFLWRYLMASHTPDKETNVPPNMVPHITIFHKAG